MTTIAGIWAEAAKAEELRRQLEVPAAIQQMLTWQREHEQMLAWRRENDLALQWQEEARRTAAAEREQRLAWGEETARAVQQAAELRAAIAAVQPPLWLHADRLAVESTRATMALGSAAGLVTGPDFSRVRGSLVHQELREWVTAHDVMRRQFADIEQLSRSTSLMHEELTRYRREEEERTRLLGVHIEAAHVKLLRREQALYRSAHSLIDQWASSPSQLIEYPEILRMAAFVSPYSAVRASVRIVWPAESAGDPEANDVTPAGEPLALTRRERDRRLATLHECVAESLAGARNALDAGGPDFAAKCAVCLRRAFDAALDILAPQKQVIIWNDPRLKLKDDGRGPTRASRMYFAFRNLPKNDRAARFMEADVLMTDALLDTINPTIHRPGGEQDVAQLDLYVQRMETLLLVLASLPR